MCADVVLVSLCIVGDVVKECCLLIITWIYVGV